MRPGEGRRFGPGECGVLTCLLFFPWDGSCWSAREFNQPNSCCPMNERDGRNLSDTKSSITARGGGPREQASLLARPESAMCTRTGRGKKEKLPAIFTVAGGCGPVPISNFEALCPNLVDYFCFLFEFYA